MLEADITCPLLALKIVPTLGKRYSHAGKISFPTWELSNKCKKIGKCKGMSDKCCNFR